MLASLAHRFATNVRPVGWRAAFLPVEAAEICQIQCTAVPCEILFPSSIISLNTSSRVPSVAKPPGRFLRAKMGMSNQVSWSFTSKKRWVILRRLTSALPAHHYLSRKDMRQGWVHVGACSMQGSVLDSLQKSVPGSFPWSWQIDSFGISGCTGERSIIQDTDKSTACSKLRACFNLERIPVT